MKEKEKKYKLKPETLALYAGYEPSKNQGSRGVPIYSTSSYVFSSLEDAQETFALRKPGFIYTRLNNPTNQVLEDRLAAYHGGSAAISFASGSAANMMLFLTLGRPGKNFITSPFIYGGTSSAFLYFLKNWGLEARFVNLNNFEELEKNIDDNTIMVFGEAVGNPSSHIIDLENIAKIAHKHNLPLVIDNTSTPPPILNPFNYGVDLLTYSLTKMVGGHGTHLGGAVVEKGDFNWGSERFKETLNYEDESYGNLNFWKALGEPNYKNGTSAVISTKLRAGVLRDLGATLSPFASQSFLTSLETLNLRGQAHCQNALKTATFLEKHPKVEWINYSGLESNSQYNLAKKYFLSAAPGAVFGFGIKGGYDSALKFINNIELFSNLANILDARTLIIHPASTTHSQLNKQQREEAGVFDNMIRLSVGLENIDDILTILDNALNS